MHYICIRITKGSYYIKRHSVCWSSTKKSLLTAVKKRDEFKLYITRILKKTTTFFALFFEDVLCGFPLEQTSSFVHCRSGKNVFINILLGRICPLIFLSQLHRVCTPIYQNVAFIKDTNRKIRKIEFILHLWFQKWFQQQCCKHR